MPDAKNLKALYAAVDAVEYALAQVGDDLLLQVKPEGGLEVVRRGPDGLPAEPQATITDVAGADPLLWQAARPEGALTLGQPYRQARPRCALSGRPLLRGAPVELYYRGRPVGAERALAFSPRLVFLQSLTYFLGAFTHELWARLPPRGEAGAAREEAAVKAAAGALWDDFLTRLRQPAEIGSESPAGLDPDPKPGVPEEN